MSEATSVVRIVVGVDGSSASVKALQEGARFAAELGGVVDAVAVWEVPVSNAVVSHAPCPVLVVQ